jgi:hypothetical protein
MADINDVNILSLAPGCFSFSFSTDNTVKSMTCLLLDMNAPNIKSIYNTLWLGV